MARLRAVTRRHIISERQAATEANDRILVFGNLEIEQSSRTVRLDAKTLNLTPIEYDLLTSLARAAGRDPDALTMSIRVEVEVHGGPSSQRAADRTRLSGAYVDAMIEHIKAYESAGVDHIVLALNSGDVRRITELMETIAQRVLPQCR